MARVLIVGCGCRGRALAAALVAEGHAVRGTTRRRSALRAIEAAGAEAVTADPGRLATVVPQLEGVTALCWLLGSASGDPDAVAALHGPRLESLLETIVDTPVRGMVYEAAGTVGRASLERGAAAARRAAGTWRIPVELVTADPRSHGVWLDEARAAVGRVLGRG